jgi:hypothetical protein
MYFIDCDTPVTTYCNLNILVWIHQKYNEGKNNLANFKDFFNAPENTNESTILNILCICFCVFILMLSYFNRVLIPKATNSNNLRKNTHIFEAFVMDIFTYTSWNLVEISHKKVSVRKLYSEKKSVLLWQLDIFYAYSPKETALIQEYLNAILFPAWEGVLAKDFSDLAKKLNLFVGKIRKGPSAFVYDNRHHKDNDDD